MKIAIVDERIPRDAHSALSRHADRIFSLPPSHRLQAPVSSHPDMLIFITESEIITSASYFKENRRLFEEISQLCSRRISLDSAELSPLYPNDVKFNCFTVGGRLFGLKSAISKNILAWAGEKNMPAVNIRQGYAKCATCVVCDNAVITEDASVERAMTASGIEVLKVSKEQVALDGYDCGFIGGSCGADRENVYFCGDLSSHTDGSAIESFCTSHGKKCVSLGAGGLYDIGTLFFIEI